jgi:hypothetical protein
MSDSSQLPKISSTSEKEPEPKGPNLIVLYVLLALGIAGAIIFAVMVVRPFYLRR